MSMPRPTLACLVLLVSTGSALAEEVRGHLAEVDLTRREIRLQDRVLLRRSSPVLSFDPDLQVLNGRTPGTLADLVPGQRVRIEYEMRDGKAVARTVHLLGPVLAAPVPLPAPGAPGAPAPAPSGDVVAGTLARVGLSDRELVVLTGRDRRAETIIAVPESCKLMKGGKPVDLEAFAVGDAVTVRVEKRDGRLTALSVQDGSTPGAAGPARPEPAVGRGEMIPKVRAGLKILDGILQQIENSR